MNDVTGSLNTLLDKLLSFGKEYADRGKSIAAQKLELPEQGPQREAMLDGLKKGAIASAVLVGLLGTKAGRSLTGSAIKIGGLAALGTAAYKGYQNWQATGDPLQSVHELSADDGEARSLLLFQAMIAAANADGHIDDDEMTTIRQQLISMHLPQPLAQELEQAVQTPMSANELASKVYGPQSASEVYLATRLLIGSDSSNQELVYLSELVAELGIDVALQQSLDLQIT